MSTIYKYELEVVDKQEIELPLDAEILNVQVQHGKPCLWAKVIPSLVPETRVIFMYGTGHPIYEPILKYISTFQIANGNLVFHVFVGE